MADERFTPGPWTNEPGLFWICDVGNNPDDPGVWSTAIPPVGVDFPFGSKEADARLIAAAPELYDALQEARKTIAIAGRIAPQTHVMRMIDRALAKAVGEQVSA